MVLSWCLCFSFWADLTHYSDVFTEDFKQIDARCAIVISWNVDDSHMHFSVSGPSQFDLLVLLRDDMSIDQSLLGKKFACASCHSFGVICWCHSVEIRGLGRAISEFMSAIFLIKEYLIQCILRSVLTVSRHLPLQMNSLHTWPAWSPCLKHQLLIFKYNTESRPSLPVALVLCPLVSTKENIHAIYYKRRGVRRRGLRVHTYNYSFYFYTK